MPLHSKTPRATNKPFWRFENNADGTAELYLYGTISETTWWGDEVTPAIFLSDLKALGQISKLVVRINSGGGDVFAAQTIGNNLETCGAYTECHIDGVCGSAATIVASHCKKVVAAYDATYMIHKPQLGLDDYFEEHDLRALADALKTVRTNILSAYQIKTGRPVEELAQEMDATSWWTASEAKEHGFVDEVDTYARVGQVENRAGVLFVNSVSTGIPYAEAEKHFGKTPETTGVSNTSKLPNNEEESQMAEKIIRTVDELCAAYPDLVNQIIQDATTQERRRIHDIEDTMLPGGESIANDAKYEHPMSTADFAVALIRDQKQNGARYLQNINDDANNGGANGVGQAVPGSNPKEDTPRDSEGNDFMASLKKAARDPSKA